MLLDNVYESGGKIEEMLIRERKREKEGEETNE